MYIIYYKRNEFTFVLVEMVGSTASHKCPSFISSARKYHHYLSYKIVILIACTPTNWIIFHEFQRASFKSAPCHHVIVPSTSHADKPYDQSPTKQKPF